MYIEAQVISNKYGYPPAVGIAVEEGTIATDFTVPQRVLYSLCGTNSF
jgi:hypothetical protein